jgi:hypothetical protein
MNGAALINRTIVLLARTDVDRDLLLSFMNDNIKDALRSKSYYFLQDSLEYSVLDGVISCPTLKNPRLVRWTDGDLSVKLNKIPDIKEVYQKYADPTESGTPAHFVVKGKTMQIIPAPSDATSVLVAGEFWPVPLEDTATSTNLFSEEIPNFLMYYGAAEYMDFLQEEKRSTKYFQKAFGVLTQWAKENRNQEMSGINNMPRDPLGNLGYNQRTKAVPTDDLGESESTVDDAGVW